LSRKDRERSKNFKSMKDHKGKKKSSAYGSHGKKHIESALESGREFPTDEGRGKGKKRKQEEELYVGVLTGHAKGFGFVTVEGMEDDFFIPASKMKSALHGDTVEIKKTPGQKGKRTEAEVVRVIARGTSQVIGTFQKSKNFGFVVPDNTKFGCDIFVPIEQSKGAVNGHKVVVEITNFGEDSQPQQNPEGKVVEILGHINDPGVDIMSIIKGYDLPVEFSEKELNQAERVAKPVSEADMEGRSDLRDLQMVTIDGEDAKDLDDAVSLTVEDGKYYLGVHIADVTNYVQESSALDRQALERGTSVYLVDRVIPMLPHALSNGMCSLNAGEDRLALSCLMTFNGAGDLLEYDIVESVIQVDRRMSYNQVKDILEDHDPELCETYRDFIPLFENMKTLSDILRHKRKLRGSIDFDTKETKIEMDEKGVPTYVGPYERNMAHLIIEDFMLAANETVAEHFFWQEVPFVYRIHEVPDPEKIKKLRLLTGAMGYTFKVGTEQIHPRELQKLLSKVHGTPDEAFISRMTLRSLKQAKYDTECLGHFGLACKYYCHFTSPIRRYPDLQIHRIIKDSIRGRLHDRKLSHYAEILPEIASHCSTMERRADAAERDTEKTKMVQYMEDHIGEEFDGVISGVTAWGIYVELPNTIEGMVPVASMHDDYYTFDEEHMKMLGSRRGNEYVLGQKVHVVVTAADRFEQTIDFRFMKKEEEDEERFPLE